MPMAVMVKESFGISLFRKKTLSEKEPFIDQEEGLRKCLYSWYLTDYLKWKSTACQILGQIPFPYIAQGIFYHWRQRGWVGNPLDQLMYIQEIPGNWSLLNIRKEVIFRHLEGSKWLSSVLEQEVWSSLKVRRWREVGPVYGSKRSPWLLMWRS